MARVNKITGRVPKKKAPRLKRVSKRGLQAPSFEGWENLDGDKFHRLKRNVNDFWYMNYKHNENIEHMFTWMKQNEYSRSDISNAKKAAKHEGLVGIYCRMLLDGCPDYNPKEQEYWQSCPGTSGDIAPMTDYVKAKVTELVEAGKLIVEEKKATTKNVYIPSIQERLEEAAEEKIAADAAVELGFFDKLEDVSTWDTCGDLSKADLVIWCDEELRVDHAVFDVECVDQVLDGLFDLLSSTLQCL